MKYLAENMNRTCLQLWCAALMILWPSPGVAAVVESSPSNPSIDNYFRVIWALLVVLGIILVLYGIFRKRFSLTSSYSTKEINIVEVKPLMGKKALCLVEVKGQEFLIGISGDAITHLATLKESNQERFTQALQRAEKGAGQ